MAKPLSPAAQKVLDAAVLPCAIQVVDCTAIQVAGCAGAARQGIAAALRAAADHAPSGTLLSFGRPRDRWISAAELRAIAAELEADRE